MIWPMIFVLMICTILFIKDLLNWAFSMENYFAHKKRLKQLKFNGRAFSNVDDIIASVGSPVGKHLVPKFKFDEDSLKRKLEFTGWDKHFSVKTYIAFNLTLKIVAVLMLGLFILGDALVIGIVWGAVMFFGLDWFLGNSVTARKEKIFADFPDFLRITQGFLSSGMPFMLAIEKTYVYMNDEWKVLLKNFIADFSTSNINIALDNLKTATDMFEIKEFVALVKLILDQGGSLKDGFDSQVETIKEIQAFLLERKIAKRKTLAIVIQAPLLICIFATFGLPLAGDMAAIGLM